MLVAPCQPPCGGYDHPSESFTAGLWDLCFSPFYRPDTPRLSKVQKLAQAPTVSGGARYLNPDLSDPRAYGGDGKSRIYLFFPLGRWPLIGCFYKY